MTIRSHSLTQEMRHDVQNRPYPVFTCENCNLETQHKQMFQDIGCGETAAQNVDTVSQCVVAETTSYPATCIDCGGELGSETHVNIWMRHGNRGREYDYLPQIILCSECTISNPDALNRAETDKYVRITGTPTEWSEKESSPALRHLSDTSPYEGVGDGKETITVTETEVAEVRSV